MTRRRTLQGWFPVLIGVAVVGMWAAPSGAATLGVPAETVIKPGDTLYVPVRVEAVSGLLGYYFELTYDDGLLEYVSTAPGSFMAPWGAPQVNPSAGRVVMAGLGSTPLGGAGTVAVAQFRVSRQAANGQTSTLRLLGAELNDGAIPVTVRNGNLTVVAVAELHMMDHYQRKPGDSLEVPVLVWDANGILGYYVEFTFNNALLEFRGARAGSLTSAWGEPAANDLMTGRVTVAGLGAEPTDGTGTLVILTFRVRDTAPIGTWTPIDMDMTELNDGAILAVPASTRVDIAEVGLPLNPWAVALALGLAGMLAAARHGCTRVQEYWQGAIRVPMPPTEEHAECSGA